MTSYDPFEISFWLDIRNPRKKHGGAFTLYLQVYSNLEKKQTFISTKRFLTIPSWDKIKKSFWGVVQD